MSSSNVFPCTFFAASHRSGSTILTRLIGELDRIGRPGEAFYPQNIAACLRKHGHRPSSKFEEWLPIVLKEGTSPNGAFSVKVFAENLHWLTSSFTGQPWDESKSQLQDLFSRHFPNARFIWIRRRDKLRQGISLHKAMQTGIWHSNQFGKVKSRNPYYQRSRIEWAVQNIQQQEAFLEEIFQLLNVTPMEIWYEDFIKDLEGTLRSIFSFIQQPYPEGFHPRPPLSKLSDDESLKWVKRFEMESRLSREHPQEELSEDIGAVFSINLLPFGEAILPGSLINGRFQIKSLHADKLYFTGDANGRGRIGLQLRTSNVTSSEEARIQQLPVPFELEKDQEEALIFHYDPPQEPGEYELSIVATQSRKRILPISGNSKLRIKVEESTVDAIRSVFGEFEFTPDNWYYSPWFGYFYTNSFPWILSLDHGWLKVDLDLQTDDGSIHVIDFILGRWSTSRDAYPAVTLGTGEVLSFEQTTDDQRAFRDANGRIISFRTSQNESA